MIMIMTVMVMVLVLTMVMVMVIVIMIMKFIAPEGRFTSFAGQRGVLFNLDFR